MKSDSNPNIKTLKYVEVRIGNLEDLESKDSELEYKGRYKTYSIPVIIGNIEPKLWSLIHIFLINKASGKVKDLNPTVKAFVSWLNFINDKKINPFVAPRLKSKSPTYGYKESLLARINNDNKVKKKSQLSSSTASLYINIIKSFYEFLVNADICTGNFFKYKVSNIDNKRKIISTDLAIRIIKKHGSTLNPLDKNNLIELKKEISNVPLEYQLAFKYMFNCGLRISESATIPNSIFKENKLINAEGMIIHGCNIGPKNGVNTKFDIEREMFMTTSLYEDTLDYIGSQQYEEKLQLWRKKNNYKSKNEPLFITRSGKAFSSSTIRSEWYKIKSRIIAKGKTPFNYKPHDLRATFATNYLASALKCFPEDIDEALESTREWMGHKDLSTTLKYIHFLNRKKISKQVAEVMDGYVKEVMESLYEEE
ncbi:MAG: site-specific integrase [Methylococcales bacterium]